jgi:hypothetical protein
MNGLERIEHKIGGYDAPKYDSELSGLKEVGWWGVDDDRIIGAVLHDRLQHVYGWVILARGPDKRYRQFNNSMPEAMRASARRHGAGRLKGGYPSSLSDLAQARRIG